MATSHEIYYFHTLYTLSYVSGGSMALSLYNDHVQQTKPIPQTLRVKLPPTSVQKNKQDGLKDAAKESVKIEQINNDRFKNLVRASNQTLYKVKTVFPFDFFPDEMSIEITQINVIKRYFFATAHLQTIPIKNVADVFLETSLFFASIKIIDSSYIENSIQVEYLKKADACRARKVIQGLVIANKEGIDLAKVPPKSLLDNIESLGKAQEVEIME